MTTSDEPKSKSAVSVVSTGTIGNVATIHGDKFSTQLAATDSATDSIVNMVDFSRFLLHLAGENELAEAPDRLRTIHSRQYNPEVPRAAMDRLIR